MVIKQSFLPKGSPSRPGKMLSAPESITIHWIGPYPKHEPETVLNWWIKGPKGFGIEASAHFVIKENRCVQAVPIGEVAWHCGSKGNYNSIGIEVIPMTEEGEFSADTIYTLQQLLQQLPKVRLLRHYDWTKKDCPRYYTPHVAGGDDRWEELKTWLREAI